MRPSRSLSVSPVPLAATVALLAVACTDVQQPTDAASIAAEHEPVASHTPPASSEALAAILLAPPAYAALDGAAAGSAGTGLHLQVDAGGDVPRHPDEFIQSVAVFGYAWADLGTGRGIVAVIHPAIGRDSRQNPDAWHTHPVQLTAGTTPGGTSDFCIVSIGRSQAGLSIQGDRLEVRMAAQWAGLSADALDVAAAFVVQPDAGCSATGLGVDVLDAETL